MELDTEEETQAVLEEDGEGNEDPDREGLGLSEVERLSLGVEYKEGYTLLPVIVADKLSVRVKEPVLCGLRETEGDCVEESLMGEVIVGWPAHCTARGRTNSDLEVRFKHNNNSIIFIVQRIKQKQQSQMKLF